MGRTLSNILGLPRHGACKGCDQPIAEAKTAKGSRWTKAPRLDGPTAHNPDGSINMSGDRCDDTQDGKHHPRDGSLW